MARLLCRLLGHRMKEIDMGESLSGVLYMCQRKRCGVAELYLYRIVNIPQIETAEPPTKELQ